MEYQTWLENEEFDYTVVLDEEGNEEVSCRDDCEIRDLEDRV